MPDPRIIIVTGANRGIGRAICDLILTKPDLAPLELFAATRSGDDLRLGARDDDTRQVLYPRLDIANKESVRAFASDVKLHGRVDVLINNAGVNLDNQYNYENAKRTVDVNYRGTLDMCQTFIPLLAPQARIVNLSSVGSSLKPYSAAMQARFRNPENSIEDLNQLAEEYLEAVQSHTETTTGFPPPRQSYSLSKALLNALTASLARSHPSLTINCCCPGWVSTDMGRLVGSRTVQPPKSPEEGARIPMRLGFGADLGGVRGAYWANGSVRGKGEGELQVW